MEIFSLLPLIYAKIFIYTLSFARIAAFLNAFILFRRWVIAQRTIVALTSMLAIYAVLLNVNNIVMTEFVSWQLFYMVAIQSLLGFIAALILNIIFEIFTAAGQIISSQIGLSIASQFDPRLGNITSLTQFYVITAFVVFFALNGHLFIMKVIIDSFQTIPVDQSFISKNMLSVILNYSQAIFNGSVLVSMALIVTILVVNLALAFVTKFAPQFNIFSVGINITLIIGLFAVYLTYQAFVNYSIPAIENGLTILKHFFPKVA